MHRARRNRTSIEERLGADLATTRQLISQLIAIHRDAMQKAKAVIDTAMSQIRPILTPDQQKKADDIHKAHEDMANAAKRLHDINNE